MARRDGEDALVVRQEFRASAEFLFDAWTDPALLARWFHARPSWSTRVVRCDVRVGGGWEIVMVPPPGEGPDCRCFGAYRAIERPRRLVFTWHANGEDDYETIVTLEFRALGPDRTELVLTQTGLRAPEDREDHRRGWDGCLASLAGLVDEAVDEPKKGRT